MAVTDNVLHAGLAPDTTLAADITDASSTITVASGTGYPSPTGGQISYIVIDPDTSSEEKLYFTGRSGTSLTGCSRGKDGTAAAAHNSGAVVRHVFTADEADNANAVVRLVLGVGSVVAGDIFYVSAASAGVPTALTRIAKGTAGQRLTMNSGATAPAWADPANPRTIGAPAWATAKANTNWSSVEHSFSDVNTYPLGYRRISGGSQNDDVTWEIPLEAGTYTFTLVHSKGSNIGIYTVALDGTSAGTIDGYNGTALAAVSTITGITVAASGVKSVRLRMATKNASSSSYYGSIQGISFTRTA